MTSAATGFEWKALMGYLLPKSVHQHRHAVSSLYDKFTVVEHIRGSAIMVCFENRKKEAELCSMALHILSPGPMEMEWRNHVK